MRPFFLAHPTPHGINCLSSLEKSMPQLPRKSIQGLAKKIASKSRGTPARRAKKGERLLLTCSSIVNLSMMEDLAQRLYGMTLIDPDGRPFRVVTVRVDGQARKIYGRCREMIGAVSSVKSEPEKPGRTLQVTLSLHVKNTSTFVRSKTKVKAQIENHILSRYSMKKQANGYEYTLTIPYDTDEQLERIIYEDILREADAEADTHHCFIEADVRALDDSGRHW
jgi:hypothetical protein